MSILEEPVPEAELLEPGKESAEQAEVLVEMEQKKLVQDAVEETASVSVDAKMEIAGLEIVEEKEEQAKVPEPEKKKGPLGKPRVPGPTPRPGGFKTNKKSAKSGTSAVIPSSTKSLTPIARTATVPPKGNKLSGPPSSKADPSRPPSSSMPATLFISSIDRLAGLVHEQEPMMLAYPLIAGQTPSALLPPVLKPQWQWELEERAKPVELAPKVIERPPHPAEQRIPGCGSNCITCLPHLDLKFRLFYLHAKQ
ncbi:hypothetical protein RhiJN_27251 [Ceratobasidium sp. AG-Ba]|nr:hypothetical protein RhiJN_27251 [Ceratobasidium sp. AG-Ba]QRW13729.1 hypothetical protein RhiLY_12728 [Ceratobasidium sp. AG-Ba]